MIGQKDITESDQRQLKKSRLITHAESKKNLKREGVRVGLLAPLAFVGRVGWLEGLANEKSTVNRSLGVHC